MNLLDIENRSIIENAIAGALKSAIHAHGPIGLTAIGSASKRVYGTLKHLSRRQRQEKEAHK